MVQPSCSLCGKDGGVKCIALHTDSLGSSLGVRLERGALGGEGHLRKLQWTSSFHHPISKFYLIMLGPNSLRCCLFRESCPGQICTLEVVLNNKATVSWTTVPNTSQHWTFAFILFVTWALFINYLLIGPLDDMIISPVAWYALSVVKKWMVCLHNFSVSSVCH